MRISARKTEIGAIVQILEDEGFDSDVKMARAIVTRAFQLLLERDWYIVGVRNGGVNLLYGPLPSENEAVKHIEPLGLGGDDVGVFKVRSVAKRKWDIVELDETKGEPDCTCGHDKLLHDWSDKRAYVKGCVIKRCRCKTYQPKPD